MKYSSISAIDLWLYSQPIFVGTSTEVVLLMKLLLWVLESLAKASFHDWLLNIIPQVLIKDDGAANEDGVTAIFPAVDETSDGGAFPQQQSSNNAPATGGRDYTFGRNSNYTPRSDPRPKDSNGFHTHSQMDDFAFMPEGTDGFYDGGSGNNDSQSRFQRQQYDKFAKRTILLANLPEAATHSDIVAVVRGGMLLDIYLRTHDRTASVSFLEEAAAHEFFRHVKRHDLYIRGKRVRNENM